LQKPLGEDVAHTLLQLPKVGAVRVSTEKPDANPTVKRSALKFSA